MTKDLHMQSVLVMPAKTITAMTAAANMSINWSMSLLAELASSPAVTRMRCESLISYFLQCVLLWFPNCILLTLMIVITRCYCRDLCYVGDAIEQGVCCSENHFWSGEYS